MILWFFIYDLNLEAIHSIRSPKPGFKTSTLPAYRNGYSSVSALELKELPLFAVYV